MICTPCRDAGEANRLRNQAPAVAEKLSVELHADCEAPTTCPCQHLIGTFIIR